MIQQVHAGADTSDKGQRQSHGVMVNYRYDMKTVSRNQRLIATSRAIAASSEILTPSATAARLVAEETE